MERSSSFSNQNQSKTSEELVRKKLNETISASASAYSFYLFMEGLVLEKVSEDIPQVLLPLEKIIENLDEFGECKSFLTNDQETLQKCIDEYNFKGGLLGGIWEYIIKKYTPKQIEEFTKGLEALAKGGKEIIDGLYRLYKEVHKLALEDISKDYQDQTIPSYKLEEARASANRTIKYLLMNYFSNPKKYEDQLMKYAGMKPLDWLDRAICNLYRAIYNLYGGCKTEKQNT